jgi:hypothetical protein
MIKMVLVGVWVCLIVGAAAYATIAFALLDPAPASHPQPKIETFNTKQISVPILREERVDGYLMLRFAVIVDGNVRKSVTARVEDLVSDEVLRSCVGMTVPRMMAEISGLPAKVMEQINKRTSLALVQQVVLQDWTYVNKSDARK